MTHDDNFVIQCDTKVRLAARKAGIEIEQPKPHLPITEQEETDTM